MTTSAPSSSNSSGSQPQSQDQNPPDTGASSSNVQFEGLVNPAPTRAPRGYVPTLTLAFLGIYIALLTPPIVSMTFKLQHISATPEAAIASLGIILGLGGLFSLVVSPLAGRLSDRTTSRFGMRRPWIVIGAAVTFVALLIIGLAPSVLIVGIGWCLAQTAISAVLSALTATLPDQVPSDRRGKVSGIVGITTPIATLGGTAVVGLFNSDVLRFAIPGAFALVFAIIFAMTLQDRVLTVKPAEPFGAKQFFGSFIFNVRKHPDFGWAWLARFAVNFAYIGVSTFLPMFIVQRFGLGEQETIGVVFAGYAIIAVAIAISSPIGGWLSDRFDNRRFFVALAGVILVVGLVVIAFAPSVAVLLAAQALMGIGAGTFYSVDLALATQVLPNPDDTAKDLGILNISSALPQSLAPALAPAVIAVGALTALGGYTVWFLFGALVALAGSVSVYRIKGVR